MIDLPPQGTEVLARMQETAATLADRIEVLPLENPEDEAHAVKICSAVKRLISEGEDQRKAAVKPYKDRSREIDAAFREPRKALERLERRIKVRLQEAALARRKAQEEASRVAFQAVREGKPEVANAALARAPEPVKHKGTTERYTWGFQASDLGKVPAEFLMLDERAVKAYLRTVPEGVEPSIPGVTFEREVVIGVRK